MPNYRAVANGNWSALATWQDDGSGSYVASTVLPGAADTVRTNNFTVTCDINATVLNISNASATSVTAGGVLRINSGVTLTATNSINGAVAGLFDSNDTLGTSQVISPTATTIGYFYFGASGRFFRFTGNLTSTASVTSAAYRPSGGNVTHIGNINATSFGYWVDMINGGTFTMVGNLTTASEGFWVRGTCPINLTGTLTSASSIAYNNTNQNITFTHIGPVITGGNNSAIVDTFGIYAGTGPFVNNGDYAAVAATRFRLINTSPTSMRLATSVGGVNRFLYTEDNVGGVPATSNVRSGTVYGIGGGLTGTLVVPSPSNVRQGVPTDNTVGTAALTPADFWNHLTSAATTPGSLGKAVADNLNAPVGSVPANTVTEFNTSSTAVAVRMRNVSTVDTTGNQIAAAL